VNVHSGGYTWDEYFTILKVHKDGTETHGYEINNGADNLNSTPANITPGLVNVGSNGLNGPHKMSQFLIQNAGEDYFIGGVPVNTTSGVAYNDENHSFRLSNDPGWRYLTGNGGYSPSAFYGYGCSLNHSQNVIPLTSTIGTFVIGEKITQAVSGATATVIFSEPTFVYVAVGLYTGAFTGTPNGSGVWTGATSHATWTPSGAPVGAPNNCPMNWALKKVHEVKWCNQCTYDGFVIENMWPDGQTGESVAADARVCSGGIDCLIVGSDGNPLTRTNDLRWTNGMLRNASGIFSVSPRALGSGDGGGISQGMNRFLCYNCLIYNTDQNEFGGSLGGDVVLYGSAGNKFIGGTASRTSNVVTVTEPVATISPGTISYIVVGPQAIYKSNPAVNAGNAYVNYNGEREDPWGPSGDGPGVCPTPATAGQCGTTVFSGGTYDSTWTNMIGGNSLSKVWDCTQMTSTGGNCANTQGTTNIWAPLCQGGIYGSSYEIGSDCQNCGLNGNYPCPPFGCGNVACTQGSEFPPDVICNDLGNGTGGCGPAATTIQSYAQSMMGIGPNDIVGVTNCTDSSFNSPTEPANPNIYAATNGVPQVLACGTITPTVNQSQSSMQLVYPNCGANGSTSSCQVNNALGFQKNFILDHVAIYTAGQARLDASLHGYATQMQQNKITNSMMYFGGTGSGIFCGGGTGCNNQEASGSIAGEAAYYTWDQQSNQIHHNAFVLPTQARAKLYTTVGLVGTTICGSIGTYSTAGNCAQWISGSTLMPLTVGCSTTQTLDTNGVPECLGLTGFLTGLSSFPSTDCTSATISTCPLMSPPWGTFDYHNFALCSTCGPGSTVNAFGSAVSGNGADNATDLFQLGPCIGGVHCPAKSGGIVVEMLSIDSAITRTQYVCTGSCGGGPWPD
jgi:hypothetical protein